MICKFKVEDRQIGKRINFVISPIKATSNKTPSKKKRNRTSKLRKCTSHPRN